MTLYAKLDLFRRNYTRQVAIAIGALAVATFIIGQLIPGVSDLLLDRGVIDLLTLLLILDISASISRAAGQSVTIGRDQDSDFPDFMESVRHANVERADLLEYSSASIEPLLVELRRKRAKVRLLLKHPDTVGPHQRYRIISQLNSIISLTMRGYTKLEVRCYREMPSVRGRKIYGSVINISWYTPDVNGHVEVLGHTNPVITARLSTQEGVYLSRMFDGLFESLWNAADSEDGRAIVERIHRNG